MKSSNQVSEAGGGWCGCCFPNDNESCLQLWGECLYSVVCAPVAYGQAQRRAGNGSCACWTLKCLICGVCGSAPYGVNDVNEMLGGDDMIIDYLIGDWVWCCCCTWTCANANFVRAVRRRYPDKDGDGIADELQTPAPQAMERDNYITDSWSARSMNMAPAANNNGRGSVRKPPIRHTRGVPSHGDEDDSTEATSQRQSVRAREFDEDGGFDDNSNNNKEEEQQQQEPEEEEQQQEQAEYGNDVAVEKKKKKKKKKKKPTEDGGEEGGEVRKKKKKKKKKPVEEDGDSRDVTSGGEEGEGLVVKKKKKKKKRVVTDTDVESHNPMEDTSTSRKTWIDEDA